MQICSGEAFSFGDDVMIIKVLNTVKKMCSDIPDDQFQRGLIFGTESEVSERDLLLAYIEFSIPLADNLELQLAGRYDDYSRFWLNYKP